MAMMDQAPRQVAVKVSPEGDRLITSGAHYLHMSKPWSGFRGNRGSVTNKPA